MAAPGVTITRRENPPARSGDTDTGKWFVVGETERGPTTEAVEVTSLSDFVDNFGGRQTFSVLYDSLDAFFREGGSRAIVGRVVGPTPVKATKNLAGSSGTALVVTANDYGSYANSWTIDVDASGGNVTLTLVGTDGDGTAFTEVLGPYATTAELAALDFDRATITAGADTTDPVATSPTALAGGTDDRGNIVDAQWLAALTLFSRDLGPGQVSAPGRTTTAGYTQLLSHAETYGRVAYLDGADTSTVATLTAAAAGQQGLDGDRASGLFAPWATIPGLTTGTTRTVPYSAIEAGITARNDTNGLSANVPAAGDNGQALYATGLSQAAWSDSQRATLNDAGVNVARVLFGGVRTYGFRTLADPDDDTNWLWLSNARLYSKVAAEANLIGEQFMFAEIDGSRVTIGAFQGALMGLLLPYWTNGSLYGATADEAFEVDVSDNTDATIAAGELHAVLRLQMSPFAERVEIEIFKEAIA